MDGGVGRDFVSWIPQLGRYGVVTVVSQIVLLAGTTLAVEVGELSPSIAYAIVLALVYVGVYLAQSYYVFESPPSRRTALRYLLTLGAMWLVNNGAMHLLHQVLGLPYLWAILCNIVGLGGVRYLVYQQLVYRSAPEDERRD